MQLVSCLWLLVRKQRHTPSHSTHMQTHTSYTGTATTAYAVIQAAIKSAREETQIKGVNKALLRLCQHVCVRVTDRAPVRAHASAVIALFSSSLAAEGMDELCKFLCRYAQNAKVHYRVFGVELVADTLGRHADAADASSGDVDASTCVITENAVRIFACCFSSCFCACGGAVGESVCVIGEATARMCACM
jgi:hypothetical protein